MTAFLLVLFGIPELPAQEAGGEAATRATEPAPVSPDDPPVDPAESVERAANTVRELVRGSLAVFPRLLIAGALLLGAAGLSRLSRAVLRQILRRWDRADAMSALAGTIIFLLAIGAALSVIAGDARALVGSVGLAGLALSWALQQPIESFAGWLLNSFKGYYRPGDRIMVGDVFGDVYRIDLLTTTVWEAGGPGKPVEAAQATGALITFPNSEVLRANITNYTHEFAWVWDEVTFSVGNDSDLMYTTGVIHGIADQLMGGRMIEPARTWRLLLERQHLDHEISEHPEVYVSLAETWTNITVRYMVPARQRRRWASELILAVAEEISRETHTEKILSGYPRARIELTPRAGRRSNERSDRPEADPAGPAGESH